jgi:predicted MFS family arabinose efflux permease
MGLLINLQVQWAAFFVFGVCMVWQDVSMNSHAVALERVADRRFMTVLHASWSIGTLLAGAIGGVVSQLGLPVFAHFALASTLLVVSLWSVRSSLLPASVDRHEPEAKGPRRRRLRRPQIQLIFVALGLIGLFEQIGEGAGSDWGGVLARTHFHTNHLVGTVPYFAFTLMMVTGRLFGDRLATRFSTRALLTASGLLVATGLGVGMAMNTMVGEVLAWLCLGLGSSTVIPLLFSATGRIAHARAATSSLSAASAIAFVTAIAYSGGLFGPPLVGFVADLVGLRHALWLPGVLGALYALGSFAILRDDHDTTGTEGVLDHAL